MDLPSITAATRASGRMPDISVSARSCCIALHEYTCLAGTNNARSCRQSCLGVALALDDDGSVVCCFSKAGYVAGVAGEDAVAGRSEEYHGRVDRI